MSAKRQSPDAAVAIASHDRPLRLRWLLNALSEQSVNAARFEVIVAHDSSSLQTEQMLRSHPMTATGQLLQLGFDADRLPPGALRNAAWQAASAPLILFIDDDCRPEVDWIERALAAAAQHPHAILQGTTRPDPDETATLLGAPWVHTQLIRPPTPWAQACNIAYPRSVLARVGGFDEEMYVGEDADLAMRARQSGTALEAVPEMRVYHAVEERSLGGMVRSQRRWGGMAALVKRHPALRRHVCAGIWWKPEHAALTAAACGLLLATKRRRSLGLAAPWLALSLRHRGFHPRGLIRAVTELPGRAAIDAAEFQSLIVGSIRHRTLLL